ncbi:cell wall-binding repeat-containing protein [Clostridium sporogenes]|uniref:cell wall-binding repeat-containing protein n=1 Tax=Clostridium sporogenes TaxID=1509 RepID=UPI0005EDC9B5|nr:cell wall-binding repeat-containing protein [Clostridium sporogenes]
MNIKKITSKILSSIFILILIIFIPFKKVLAAPKVTRLYGQDRYQTSKEIVKSGWSVSKNLVITSGEDFADALCAVPLAKQLNSPILLNSKSELNNDQIQQIKNLKVERVFIIGGYSSISKSIEDKLRKNYNLNVIRLSGKNRYETSISVANYMYNNFTISDNIVVASGNGFADALSIAPIAAKKGFPIILSPKDTFLDETSKFLSNKKISKSYIVGGSGVINDSVLSKFPFSERIGGTDRYDTNSKIINHFTDYDYTNVYVASGENFPDALSGAALAAKNSSFIILTSKAPSDTTQNFTYNICKKNSSNKNLIVLGGTGVIPNESIKKLTTKEEDYFGNKINGSSIIYDRGYIYYRKTSDKGSLHRIKADGSNDTKIINDPVCNTIIDKNYIYYNIFSFNNSNGLYRTTLDGKNKIKLSDDNFFPFSIALEGNYIYYIKNLEDGEAELWKMKTDGSSKSKISFNIKEEYSINKGYGFCIKNGWIYANIYISKNADEVESKFIMAKTDGSEVRVIANEPFIRFQPVDDYIYYSTSNGIYKIKNDGTNNTLLTSNKYKNNNIFNLNVCNDYIYYSVIADEHDAYLNGIYKMNLDGTGETRLIQTQSLYLWTTPKWIYFDTGEGISRINYLGEELYKIK